MWGIMDNLEFWEELRIIAYIISFTGIIIYLLGAFFNAASFGTSEIEYNLIILLSDVFRQTGTGCIAIGAVLATITGRQ